MRPPFQKYFLLIKNHYEKRNIRYIIFLSFTLTAVLAVLFAGLTFYMRFSSQLDSITYSENELLVEQVSQSISTYLRDMIRLSNSLCYNVIKNTDIERESVTQEMHLLYSTNQNYVENIALFSSDGKLLATAPPATMKDNVNVIYDDWFVSALEKTEDLHFSMPSVQSLFADTENQYKWVVSLSSAVEITRGKSTEQGVLLVDLKYSSLTQEFNNTTLAKNGYIYLTNSVGEIIYHPEQQLIASGLVTENNEDLASYTDGSYVITKDGKQSTMLVSSVGYTGWKVIGIIPHQGLSLNKLQNILFIVFILLLFFDILIMINSVISTRLTDPLKKLEESVVNIEQQAWDSEIYSGGSYEIVQLSNAIKSMMGQLKKLSDDIVQEHEQKQKSELDALQAQINPHLLYNTLDIIVWMVENERPSEAVRIVTALARLFRISLSRGKKIISVRDELKHVENYLVIQTMRYKNKFNYSIKAEGGVLDMATIKLIVQPLVENAIYHSMEYKDGDGMIEIEAKVVDEKLIISVSDNGMGMTEDMVSRLLVENMPISSGSGVGLKNVHDRLRLWHGEGYGVVIESEPDAGTKITLIQPVRTYDSKEAENG